MNSPNDQVDDLLRRRLHDAAARGRAPAAHDFDLLSAYVDGSCTPAERARIEMLLEHDASLRECVEAMRALERESSPVIALADATRVRRTICYAVGSVALIAAAFAFTLLVIPREKPGDTRSVYQPRRTRTTAPTPAALSNDAAPATATNLPAPASDSR
ncbi:hypothetical protein GX586_00165 [bacterium]|nr:hypothetical protein [bacterium]